MKELDPPQRPILVRYLVAGNSFEVTEKYILQHAIGQGIEFHTSS